ncbi:MAG TPA: hypothetical protein VK992_00595 [Candidatus Caenarcaniphilales bacterium]|nr:hypothetical protein [Candidatus Caenarcaniphilales bacterium]
MRETMEGGAEVSFPVDDATYNLMTTLTEKLQALDSYRIYSEDVSGDELALYQELIDEDTRHAERIWQVLKERIANS